jgi:hypothetical protein
MTSRHTTVRSRTTLVAAWIGIAFLLWIAAAVLEAASGGEAKKAGPASPPPAARPDPADNSYCYVCHANYEGEKLVKAHQSAGVGCESCHGASVKHSGDEDGLTPPEKMFAKAEVNAYCRTCHEKSKLLKREEHRDSFKDADPNETCDDCHAEKHRLKVRTRIWDKKSGKLLKDDGVRMMQKDSPATEGAAAKGK